MADPDHVTKFSTLAPLHALAANYTPKEGREAVASMETFLTAHNLDHLLAQEFCVVTFASGNDKMSLLRLAMAQRAAASLSAARPPPSAPHLKSEGKDAGSSSSDSAGGAGGSASSSSSSGGSSSASSSSSGSSSALAIVVSDLPPVASSGPFRALTASANVRSAISSATSSRPRFLDPIAEPPAPESVYDNCKRFWAWAAWVTAFVHFPSIVGSSAEAGNFALSFSRLRTMVEVAPVHSIVEACRTIMNLTKSGSVTFKELRDKYVAAEAVMKESSDPTMILSPNLCAEVLLQAVEKDSRYNVDTALLRRSADVLSPADVLHNLGLNSSVREATASIAAMFASHDGNGGKGRGKGKKNGKGKGGGGGRGGGREDDPAPKAPHSDPRGCFAWRDRGVCRQGDLCPFQHDPAQCGVGSVPSGAGTPSPSAAPPGAQVVNFGKNPSGRCFECGSPDHGVGSCPVALAKHAPAGMFASVPQQQHPSGPAGTYEAMPQQRHPHGGSAGMYASMPPPAAMLAAHSAPRHVMQPYAPLAYPPRHYGAPVAHGGERVLQPSTPAATMYYSPPHQQMAGDLGYQDPSVPGP